ncbi:hypothetical protein ACFTAO_40575 [Paenibacillus rhizoplanae]
MIRIRQLFELACRDGEHLRQTAQCDQDIQLTAVLARQGGPIVFNFDAQQAAVLPVPDIIFNAVTAGIRPGLIDRTSDMKLNRRIVFSKRVDFMFRRVQNYARSGTARAQQQRQNDSVRRQDCQSLSLHFLSPFNLGGAS